MRPKASKFGEKEYKEEKLNMKNQETLPKAGLNVLDKK